MDRLRAGNDRPAAGVIEGTPAILGRRHHDRRTGAAPPNGQSGGKDDQKRETGEDDGRAGTAVAELAGRRRFARRAIGGPQLTAP